MIEDMSEYRQALAGRYNQLATMPSRRLKLERYVNYDNKKLYIFATLPITTTAQALKQKQKPFPEKSAAQLLLGLPS